jgi:hypothetical protein
MNMDGLGLWTQDGVPVCQAPNRQWYQQIVSDETAGVVVVWMDERNGESERDVYAQRLDSSGMPLWPTNGVAVCTARFAQEYPRVVTDGTSGFIFAWVDAREGQGHEDIFAQKVNLDGITLWQANGSPVADYPGSQTDFKLIPTSLGGAVVVWSDARPDPKTGQDIFGQQIDTTGNRVWSNDAVPLCIAEGNQYSPFLVPDGQGGAIVAWTDLQLLTLSGDIFAQRISSEGCGSFDPVPHIRCVLDIPNDQGGETSIQWAASSFDYYPQKTITHYSIWRSLTRLGANSDMALTGRCVGLNDVGRSFQEPVYMLKSYAGATYIWEWIDNRESHYFDTYAYTASTLYDSTRAGTGYHYFLVAAHTDDPFVFWDSAPDSGYSVDNLAPRTPQGLTGQYNSAPSLLTLHWHANSESDLSGYRVYRGGSADFGPSEGNLVVATQDTVVSGLNYFPSDPWYIKVSAVDIHGNESGFVVLPPEYVTIPTLISSYHANWVRGAVEVSWIMATEGVQYEYQVLRKTGDDEQYTELSCEINGQGKERVVRDATAEAGKLYWYRVLVVDEDQPVTWFETSITTPPFEFALYQNAPNPFNPSTRIDFTLDMAGPVSLRIYDISGRLVRSLVDGHRSVKSYTEEWDGRDDLGNEVASGIYFVQLTAGNKTLTRKAVLVR